MGGPIYGTHTMCQCHCYIRNLSTLIMQFVPIGNGLGLAACNMTMHRKHYSHFWWVHFWQRRLLGLQVGICQPRMLTIVNEGRG